MNTRAFFKLSYGLYLITSKNGDNANGYIANTAFQVTADPPQIAISCHKNNYSAGIIDKSGNFVISVLEKDTPSEFIGLFGYNSGREKNKFEAIDYNTGKTGAPIVKNNSVAFFECEVVDKFDVGSHILFIGKVVNSELLHEDKSSLTYDYYRDVKKGHAPKNAPTYIDKSEIRNEEPKKVDDDATDLGGCFTCPICGYVYDPEQGDETQGIPPGTAFADLPDDWICPICAAAKSEFVSEN